jgi:hypothetical protein
MMAKEVPMTRDQREIHRKKRVLKYADKVGNINKACRYFGGIGISALPGFVWVDEGENRRGFRLGSSFGVVCTVSRCKIELSMRDSWGSKIHGE